MDWSVFMERITTILVVMIPSYFSYRSTQTSKEADKRLSDLSDKIVDLEKSVHAVEEIGKDNNKNLSMIGKGLQRIQRFRLQENLKKLLNEGKRINTKLKNSLSFTKATWNSAEMARLRYCSRSFLN